MPRFLGQWIRGNVGLVELGFEVEGALITDAGVEPAAVVEALDVIEDGAARFGSGAEALAVDEFVFEAAPERFDVGVVVAVAGAAHRGDEAVGGEGLPERAAGELAAAIRMHNDGGLGPSGYASRRWSRLHCTPWVSRP